MRTLIIRTLITFAFYACGPNEKSVQKARYDEVMAIHDEVMPKTGTIRKLKGELRAKAESLSNFDSLSIEAQKILGAIKELEAANESMMVWMRAFSEPAEETQHDEVLKFYAEELEKVREVREKILTSIEKAETMK